MAFVGGDAEVEVESRGWEPGGDMLGPLDREAVGRGEEILEHERVELRGAVEAVGVEMDERAGAAVEREDREGRARDRFADAEAAGEALDEGGLADAEVAVEREGGVGLERGGESGGEGLRLGGGSGRHAGAELVEDRHRRAEQRRGIFLTTDFTDNTDKGGGTQRPGGVRRCS